MLKPASCLVMLAASAFATLHAQRPAVDVEIVATGLTVPWSMAVAPDGRIFVTKRPGTIRVITGGKLADAPWAQVPVLDGNPRNIETGLMGLALDPGWIPALAAQASAPSSTATVTLSLIDVGDDRSVDIGKVQFPLTEPLLAANPRNAGHLLAGVIVVTKPDLTERSCAALISLDTGRTWKTHVFPVKSCGDPYAAILSDGSALMAMLGHVADTTHLFVFRSPDGGLTWSARPVVFPGNHDHGTLVVDHTGSAFDGNVNAVSQGSARDAAGKRRQAVVVARSSDGGVAFGQATPVIHGNLWMTAMNPVVLSDGMLAVPWGNVGRIMADGEFAWLVHELDWVVTSVDGGRTFSTPLFVGDECGRAFPVLAADGSAGPYRDRLYWVCNDRTCEHVYLHYSADRGSRWSDAVVVNQGAGREPYARTAAIAVNRDGVVGIAWYDGRADGTGDRRAMHGGLT